MIEIKGDLFKEAEKLSKNNLVLACVTTNGVIKSNGNLVMGAGIAKIAADIYKELPSYFGKLVIEKGNIPHLFNTQNPLLKILSFPTKDDWKKPSRKSLIEYSMKGIINYYNDYKNCKVIMPKPGCSLGGLNWNEVKPILEQFNLNDDFIICDLR